MINLNLLNRSVYTGRVDNELINNIMKNISEGDTLEGVLVQHKNELLLKIGNNIKIPVSLEGSSDSLIGELRKYLVKEISNNIVNIITQQFEDIEHGSISNNTSLANKVINELNLPNDSTVENCINKFIDNGITLDKNDITQTYQLSKYFKVPTDVIINLLNNKATLSNKEAADLNFIKEYSLEVLVTQIKDGLASETNIKNQITIIDKLEHIINKESIPSDKIGLLEEVKKAIGERSLMGNNGIADTSKLEIYQAKLSKIIRDMCDTLIVKKKTIKGLKEQSLELPRKVEELLKEFGESHLRGIDKSVRDRMESGLKVMEKVSLEGNYFIFPYEQCKVNKDAEVYIYKKARSKKGLEKEEVYAVVSLDLNEIRHVEIHIKLKNKNINLSIKVENEDIERHFNKHMYLLKKNISELGYNIASHRYIKNEEQKEECSAIENICTSFDVKA